MKYSIRIVFFLLWFFANCCWSLTSDGYYDCPTTDRTYKKKLCKGSKDKISILMPTTSPCCDLVTIRCSTGMISEFVVEVGKYYLIYLATLDGKFFMDMRGFIDFVDDKPKRYLCPVPIGYIYFDQFYAKQTSSKEKYLPYGDGGENYKKTQPQTCNKHSDCPQFDSFCGNVVNMRFEGGQCRHYSTHEIIMNVVCMQKSDCRTNSYICEQDLYLKYWTMMEREMKFCYKNPAIPGDTGIQQFQKRDTQLNIFICDNDSDCDIGSEKSGICGQQKEGENFIKWTGLVKDGSTYGKRKSYTGICLESKPISFTLSNIFINLDFDQKNEDIGRTYLSVVWKSRELTPQCTKNSECKTGEEFCDNIYSLRDEHNFDKTYKFCFKIPDPPNTYLSYTIFDDKIGLVPCNSYKDCQTAGADINSFCYTADSGKKYMGYDAGAATQFDGICMSAKICVDPSMNYEWAEGIVARDGHCENDDDCLDNGKTTEASNINNSYEYRCKNETSSGGVGLCCYRKTENCEVGKIVIPNTRCGKGSNTSQAFAQCYSEKPDTVKYNKWCEKKINQCCLDDNYPFCPDQQTPLFNEPECVGAIKTDVNSGKCEAKSGGICKRGHCCPNASMNNSTGIFVKPEFAYITEISCNSLSSVVQFTAGYCDPDSEKVVIIGEKLSDGTALKKWPEDNPKNCNVHLDCSSDNSKLCLREEPATKKFTCFYNPLKPYPEDDSNMIFIILIIVLVVLLVVGGIGGFLLWKLKLKKKNKGKTGKNEKDGKKPKKEKKKGKKGKKSNKKTDSTTKSASGVSGNADGTVPTMI